MKRFLDSLVTDLETLWSAPIVCLILLMLAGLGIAAVVDVVRWLL